jgi:mono/diheme cytochrome c family protein
VLLSRATDDAGFVQPTRTALIAERGLATDYHFNQIVGWKVRRRRHRHLPRGDLSMRASLLLTLLAVAACGGGTAEGSATTSAVDTGRRYGIGRPGTRFARAGDGHRHRRRRHRAPPGKGTVAEGGVLYKAQCAMCHGQNGEGMAPAFPQLTGRPAAAEDFRFAKDPKLPHTIGNYWSHATTLFDYIKRAMPHTAPGSLTDDQVYALSAYLLAVNDVIADDATLDAAALRAVKMPYADRFVPDDRRPGAAR